MSAENLCRRSTVLHQFMRLRNEDRRSFAHMAYWEDRLISRRMLGEPISIRSAVKAHDPEENLRDDAQLVEVEERVVYTTGIEKPSIAQRLREAGITREAVDPHALLDDLEASQAARWSEALKRERQGSLTKRWAAYLSHVRAYLISDHVLAFRRKS